MNSKRVFRITYVPPTTYRGSQVLIHCLHTKASKRIAYDQRYCSIGDIADVYLESIGIFIDSIATTDSETLLLTDNFETKLV